MMEDNLKRNNKQLQTSKTDSVESHIRTVRNEIQKVPSSQDGYLKKNSPNTNFTESLQVQLDTTSHSITVEEMKTLINGPKRCQDITPRMRTRDSLILSSVYETWARRKEIRLVVYKYIDLDECSILIKFPKIKCIPVFKIDEETGQRIYTGQNKLSKERPVYFTEETRHLIEQFMEYIPSRNKDNMYMLAGTKSRQGKVPIGLNTFNDVVKKYAEQEGIQKILGYHSEKRPIHKFTPQALREAGERHTLMASQQDVTAEAITLEIAGHSKRVAEKNYRRYNAKKKKKIINHHPSWK